MSHKVFHPFVVLILALSLSFVSASNAFATRAQQAASNLIVNGDFEAGNTGFSSGYTLGPINLLEGVYGMLTDPFSVHPAATSFGDHTSGLGLMMAVNGVGSPGIVVWSQSVPVTANTDYEFSAWIASWHPVSPAQLQFVINGSSIGTFNASSTTGIWQQFAVTWNSGASTLATIEIINLNIEPFGNDFALDDLTLRSLACASLIVNDDFEAGNTGFSSGYTLGPINLLEGVYGMLTDPFSIHPAATSFGDHTSGLGLMMAVNGVGSPGIVVWSQSVPVTANTDYEFSAWIASWHPVSPAQLQFVINGSPIGTFNASSTTGIWQQFAVTWNSGASTLATIEIINLNIEPFGNDFALDDLTLRSFTCDTPTDTPTPTNTPGDTPTNTPTPTDSPTSDLGQLKVCEVAGSGIPQGQVFTIKVGNINYNVPAGYCVLAGQFPQNTQVTVQETIPASYYVSGIEVKPDSRTISHDSSIGMVVVKIGSGVTEVIFTNKITGTPTPTRTPTPASTSTPRPTHTPTSTPSCAPNCTPTPTPIPAGRMQVCKEADGAGVSGNFTFRFNTKSRSIPVGACTLIISVNAGTLTITEDAQAGYVASDIYTIPAGRLISKDLNNRSATVTIVEGYAASQTIVVFVNRAATSQVITNVALDTQTLEMRMRENPLDAFMQVLRNSVRGWLEPARATVYTQ